MHGMVEEEEVTRLEQARAGLARKLDAALKLRDELGEVSRDTLSVLRHASKLLEVNGIDGIELGELDAVVEKWARALADESAVGGPDPEEAACGGGC